MTVRYGILKRRAKQVLEDARVLEAPVPVEKIAAALGATIRYEPFDGELSGMIHRGEKGEIIIGVNALHPLTRKRFTIAHELGHLLLHKEENLHIDNVDDRFPIGFRNSKSSMAVDDNEIEANQFAAELLMPISLLKKDMEGFAPDTSTEEIIGKLAEKYGVSTQSMTIRLSHLGKG